MILEIERLNLADKTKQQLVSARHDSIKSITGQCIHTLITIMDTHGQRDIAIYVRNSDQLWEWIEFAPQLESLAPSFEQ